MVSYGNPKFYKTLNRKYDRQFLVRIFAYLEFYRFYD